MASRAAAVVFVAVLGGCGSYALHERAIAHNAEGIRRLQEGDLEGAAAAFHLALEYNDRFSEPYNNLALVAIRRGQFDHARELLERAIRLNPDFAEAWTNLGFVRLRTGDPARAIDAFEEAIRADPGQLDARFDLVQALAEVGRLQDAWEHVLRLDVASPDDPAVQGLAATIAVRLGRIDEARGWATRALAADPQQPLASFALGVTFLGEGRAAEAEPFLRVAAEAELGAPAWDAWGTALLQLERWPEARAAFERSWAQRPKRIETLLGIGTAAMALGDVTAAKAALRQAFEMAEREPELVGARTRDAMVALLRALSAADSSTATP